MSSIQDTIVTEQALMDNPLVWPIFDVLRSEPKIWKVHTLAAKLNEQGYISDLDASPNRDMFKRNFLIMNGLYQLQEALLPDNWLQVNSMNIVLSSQESATDSQRMGIDVEDPLRSYYTDWANYETSDTEVKRLLNQFWQQYRDYVGCGPALNMDRTHALNLFQLSSDASFSDIRKRWRKLALRWHPDRDDGDVEQFRLMCEAWHVLRHNDQA
ncbi:DNA-J related domain-containing protein [Vibrio sp. RC27]